MNIKHLTLSLGADVAQVNRQISTAGVEFMDAALNAVIVALKSIRDQADSVLRKFEQPRRERSLGWKCTTCGHGKHFTRPALAKVAALRPKCGGAAFDSI